MAAILITEDDEAVRSFVARALEMEGHAISLAEDGDEGLDALRRANGDYDLLLTDIKMPYMDGIELAQNTAQLFPALKIMMMTGYADQRERADGLDKIVIDVVSKPFSLAEIRKQVNLALTA